MSNLGYGLTVRQDAALYPAHNQASDLGGPSNYWRYCYFTAIGVQLGASGPR